MKILHIDLEKSLRGGQKQVINLIEELKEFPDVENLLVCKNGSELAKYAEENGIAHKKIKVSCECDLFAVLKLKGIILSENPDIVHFHSGHAHSIGYLALKNNRKIKKIITRRVHFDIRNNFFTKKKYADVDKVVCISKYIRGKVREYGVPDKNIELIYSGVKFREAVNNISYLEKEFKIGSRIKFGMLTALVIGKHKDFRSLFEAIKILKNRNGDFVFFIIGTGKDRKKIISISKELNISDRIMFTGFRYDIPELLSFLDIYVHSAENEGLGTSIIEAMGMGLPVIATEAGGIPEIIENNKNGFLCKIKDGKDLADKMEILLQDDKLRENIGDNNKVRARDFSSEFMVKKNYELYKELLRNKE